MCCACANTAPTLEGLYCVRPVVGKRLRTQKEMSRHLRYSTPWRSGYHRGDSVTVTQREQRAAHLGELRRLLALRAVTAPVQTMQRDT